MNILDPIFADWTRAGVFFSARASDETPDLETLLSRTASECTNAARLFEMSVSWLSVYGELLAKHRMVRLARKLSQESQATLGLMLELAQSGSHPQRFRIITQHLARLSKPLPLFAIERTSPALTQRSFERASELSLAWGVWCEPIEIKLDALRPASWILKHNPSFIARADFQGDLRASILAALMHDPQAGESELQLARCAGGSRSQVRAALANLELTGKVICERGGTRTCIKAA